MFQAWRIYTNSFYTNQFYEALKCESKSDFKNGDCCRRTPREVARIRRTPRPKDGVYFLRTQEEGYSYFSLQESTGCFRTPSGVNLTNDDFEVM